MNQQVVQEAVFLLRRKVQVAIVLYVMENCHENLAGNENILNYFKYMQQQYRKKVDRCNLLLERKILYDQMLQLVPKICEFQTKFELFSVPMEIDLEGEIDPVYVNYSLRLSAITEFLDALHFLQLLLKKSKSVSSADILYVFSKLQDFHFDYLNSEQKITKISTNSLKLSVQHINLKKVARECVIEIVKLFKIYLSDMPRKSSLSHKEALIWMKKANRILIKCMDNLAYEGQYQDIVINLLQESLEYTFSQYQSKNLHYDCYRKYLIKEWKNHKLLCTNSLNILTLCLEEIREKGNDNLDKKKCIITLKYFMLFLKTYCEIHYERKEASSSEQKENYSYSLDSDYLETWTKSITPFITSDCRYSIIPSLAWSCFKIISSTEKMDSTEKGVSKYY